MEVDAQSFFRQFADSIHAGRGFGPPYEAGGCTVIPVAYVLGGGGGGSESRPPQEAPLAGSSPRIGFGAGWGYVCWPMGAYVVREGDARWVPAVDTATIVLVGAFVLRSLARAALRRR